MFKTIVDRISFFDVYSQHSIDEIQCWVADRIPIGRRVVKSTTFDLLCKGVGIFLGVKLIRERRKSAEADVENNS